MEERGQGRISAASCLDKRACGRSKAPSSRAGCSYRQGNESRLTSKRAEDLEQVLRIPRGSFSPSLDRSLVAALSYQGEGAMAGDGPVLGTGAGAWDGLVP